jgi:DNA-directed RNA polymerase I subunit RPA49
MCFRNNDLTRWNIDNLMTHICAAALLVDNLEVDMNDLREDLKLELKEYVHPTPPCLNQLTNIQNQTILP